MGTILPCLRCGTVPWILFVLRHAARLMTIPGLPQYKGTPLRRLLTARTLVWTDRGFVHHTQCHGSQCHIGPDYPWVQPEWPLRLRQQQLTEFISGPIVGAPDVTCLGPHVAFTTTAALGHTPGSLTQESLTQRLTTATSRRVPWRHSNGRAMLLYNME